MKNAYARLVSALVIVAALAAPAGAVTIQQDFTTPLSLGALPIADTTTGTVRENVVRTQRKVRLSPWLGTTNVLHRTGIYTAVLRNSSATYLLGAVKNSLSLMWGSVDAYNSIEFLRNGSVVDTVLGSDLFPTAPKGTGFSVVTIKANLFDAIRFKSTSNSFEYANLQTSLTAVPLPAGGVLLIFGLGALGLAARKRRAA